MAYGDFDLKTVVRNFELAEQRDADMFADVEPIEPSAYLTEWLAEFSPVALGMSSEKARSEYIVLPILAEAKRRSGTTANVLSGVTFDVDRDSGLNGYCDFLIARSAKIYYVQAPIVAVVEAKKEDLIPGLGPCAAEMVAIRLFNEREGSAIPAVFGCVTSGSNWKFLKLEGNVLSIDLSEYYIRDVAKILGIMVRVIRD